MLSCIQAAAKHTIRLVVILFLAVCLAVVAFIMGMVVADSVIYQRSPYFYTLPLVYRT